MSRKQMGRMIFVWIRKSSLETRALIERQFRTFTTV
jgi:hypothetical protein